MLWINFFRNYMLLVLYSYFVLCAITLQCLELLHGAILLLTTNTGYSGVVTAVPALFFNCLLHTHLPTWSFALNRLRAVTCCLPVAPTA